MRRPLSSSQWLEDILPLQPLLLLVLTFTHTGVRGDVLYGTFGPGQTFSPNAISISALNSSAFFYQAVAQSFIPSKTATLGNIQIPLICSSGINSFTIRLSYDNAGRPGAVLESFSITGVPDWPDWLDAIQTVNSSAHPTLLGSQKYWLEVLPGGTTTSGGWLSRDDFPNSGSTVLAIDQGSGWQIRSLGTGPQAFQINSVEVPEPQTSALVAIGALLLPWRRLRCKARSKV